MGDRGWSRITPYDWGDDAICLALPGFAVEFRGLSEAQSSAICESYGPFVHAGGTERPDPRVCCVARMAAGTDVISNVGDYDDNGNYVLRKTQSPKGVEINGIRFRATLGFLQSGLCEAELSVAEEADLGKPIVMENFLRATAAYGVLRAQGVLLHSAGIVHQGRAFLFSGYSNAGKSTLCRKAALAGAQVLSDDTNMVILENGEYRAHKVPFTGEFGRSAENTSGNGSFPLGGLVLLEKKSVLTASRASKAMAVAGLLANCPFVNDDPEEFPTLTDILTDLVGAVPVIRLGVARDDAFEAIMNTVQESLAHA